MNSAVDVSVIIVNYNGLRFLQQCLDSAAKAFERHSAEVIVVDNASTDGSQAYLRARKDIIYIESTENLGFTGGNNLGGKSAKGEVILLLNNDTSIATPLDRLIDEAMAPGVGAAGCRLIYGDGRQQFSVGYDHRPLRVVFSWLGLEKVPGLPSLFRRAETGEDYYGSPHADVDWVSGAALATRRAVWTALGGLDDRFFMYCEDVDYCLRARQHSYRVSYVSVATVVHYEGAGRDWIGEAALRRTARSYTLLLAKHYGSIHARAAAFSLGAVFLCRGIAFFFLSKFSKGRRRKTAADKGSAYWRVAQQLLIYHLQKI